MVLSIFHCFGHYLIITRASFRKAQDPDCPITFPLTIVQMDNVLWPWKYNCILNLTYRKPMISYNLIGTVLPMFNITSKSTNLGQLPRSSSSQTETEYWQRVRRGSPLRRCDMFESSLRWGLTPCSQWLTMGAVDKPYSKGWFGVQVFPCIHKSHGNQRSSSRLIQWEQPERMKYSVTWSACRLFVANYSDAFRFADDAYQGW